MKNTVSFLLSILGIMFMCACEDEDPVAAFTFRDETTSTFVMATYDTCTLVNTSQNAQSVSWDLGDGRTSSERDVVLSYENSGTYEVTLSVTEDGKKATVSKEVIVKDRVLRSIEISQVDWRANINNFPSTGTADIYLQIQEYTDTEMTDDFLCATCPVLYTSDVVSNVNNPTTTPITIPVTEKIIIDKKMIRFALPENVGQAYLISLMAHDEEGNVFCLQNNRGGLSYFGILTENFTENEFIIQNGGWGSDYQLVCDFE